MVARVTGVLAAVVVALMLPGVASAAVPANDDFADREVLSGSLPIEVTRANDEATKEAGEFHNFLAPAGHSVWFEWEAPASGWVTIGSCEADFRNGLVVYTGTAVDALTNVGVGTGEGPGCAFGNREFTIEAEAGTTYKIAVDGNSFTPFPEFPPDTEGTFTLRIEPTPEAPNDDFAEATPIASQLEETYEGKDFWASYTYGYNWNATTEAGEPVHAGGDGGASVWYRWTAPASGSARIGACCALGWRTDVYTGTQLGDLQEIASSESVATEVAVTAGATYWMAVYGVEDGGGEPKMGGFNLMISMRVPTPLKKEDPPVPAGPGPPAADLQPPQTTIRKRSVKPDKGGAEFRFASSETGSSFRCRLDGKPLRPCRSPARFGNLGAGKHTFRVFAVDAAGNADPTPALARFRIGG